METPLDLRPPDQASAASDAWEDFFQAYEPLVSKLAVHHPEFTRALHQLERDTRLQHEHQSAQVLATLRLKDKRILELQNTVKEQREQLDVVLDELERKATTMDMGIQVDNEPKKVETAAQMETIKVLTVDVEVQASVAEEGGVTSVLEKLETNLKKLEKRNQALETELQSRSQTQEKTKGERNEQMEACLEILQRGVDAMDLSCSCMNNPLALFTGVPTGETLSTCVNLEHRLEAQTIRLEHVQECLCLWREAAVQLMKKQDANDRKSELRLPTISPGLLASPDENVHAHCAEFLRGALSQIRKSLFRRQSSEVVHELAKHLTTKAAAKMVIQWAGWEAKHLEEVRSLRQGFAEERAIALCRRTALLKHIDLLEQQQVESQAEVKALKKQLEAQNSQGTIRIASAFKEVLADQQKDTLTYPQLLLKLATAEQTLLGKDEQLKTANDTIRALSSFTPSPDVGYSNALMISGDLDTIDPVNRLAVVQHGTQQKIDFFLRREKDLMNLSQYFQLEKASLQLQARLKAAQKQTAMLESVKSVCERERDELLMKVEKLEMEMMLTDITKKSKFASERDQEVEKGTCAFDDPLYYALKKQRLLEETVKELRGHLRCSLQQIAMMKQQHQGDAQQNCEGEHKVTSSILDCVAEHHHKCVAEFKGLQQHRRGEWEVLLSHYDALWIAFYAVFSLQEDSSMAPGNPQKHLDFELLKRDEKIFLLQQTLADRDAQLNGIESQTQQIESVLPSIQLQSTVESERIDRHVDEGWNDNEHARPFLVSKKPPEQPQSVAEEGHSKTITNSMVSLNSADTTSIELENCLAKCAKLTTQNAKLSRRLRAEKDSSKQHLEKQHELQMRLSASITANSGLKQNLVHMQQQITSSSLASTNELKTSSAMENRREDDNGIHKNRQETEALREQLSSREQENLTLVQSLCTIKEKCAQMEATHQKELRIKAAEHAANMESYMATVNETLSRIENDKIRLEEECSRLRTKLQRLEDDNTRLKLEPSQLSSKGTSTEDEKQANQDVELLEARVQDLELQLTRERKLAEAVERNQQVVIEQGQQEDSKLEIEVAKTKELYIAQAKELQDWRSKLQDEFTECQTAQRTAQQESDRRIAFLSACVEEFVRLSSSTPGETITTKKLYDLVMELARSSSRSADSKGTDMKWTESSMVSPRSRDELEMSELSWWKVRTAKLEAYVRAAAQQNETFEDTIQKLELRMVDVKDELSTRLTCESQYLATIAALKSELATTQGQLASTKEEAALLADKYQQVSAEMDKRQSEASSRGDETQRTRMAMQRKTELLAQQKAKVASLQQELEQATKKVERLAVAERQAAQLQQKAKESSQQLLHARQVYDRCHDDNVQLSFHVEKLKEKNVGLLARLKAARAENAQLRIQFTELKSSSTDPESTSGGKSNKSTQRGKDAVSGAALTEEARALKRRVLQKQDVIVSYKAKLTEQDAQLERQRETMVKLARTNRELQQTQRQRQLQEQESNSRFQVKLETQLEAKQEQLDGLRASVYDSFEAFVHCHRTAPKSLKSSSSSLMDSPLDDRDLDNNDKLLAIRRWTDFSSEDLEELKIARGSQRKRKVVEDNNARNRHHASVALRDVESALETNPEDCRAEMCELLQCLCG